MSYLDAMSRVANLQAMMVQVADPLAAQTAPPAQTTAPAATQSATSPTSFSDLLATYTDPTAASGATDPTASVGTAGQRALAAAETQIGQAEQPPGSNDGPAIARYRSAVQGSYAGAPWCAYFVSWAAAQAGAPLGDHGQGFGSVAEITDWARSTGRLTSQPQAGDLILFGTAHIGIVKSVNPDGSLTTVEGNASDAVSVEHHWPSDATGFVRL